MNWQQIQTAPRDGTPIEIRNSYGVAPTFSVCKWSDRSWERLDGQDGGNPMDGPHLAWRPYHGDPRAYVDPTGGAQLTSEYWRRAAARSRGLPDDFFEKKTIGQRIREFFS